MKLTSVFGFCAIALASVNVFAVHVDMKPGLWEQIFKLSKDEANSAQQTQKMQMLQAMEEMKKMWEKMPPEQRKMMEGMMRQQGMEIDEGGFKMPEGFQFTKDGTIIKSCISQEEINRGEFPAPENCESNITQTSRNTFKLSYVCKGNTSVQGIGEVTFQNSKSYTGKMAVSTEINNKSETFQGEISGKWLSNNCGNIKPESQK